MLRGTCVELGLNTSVVGRPLHSTTIKELVIPNTVLQSRYHGCAVYMARRSKDKLRENYRKSSSIFTAHVADDSSLM
jgi:hypothetical protein